MPPRPIEPDAPRTPYAQLEQRVEMLTRDLASARAEIQALKTARDIAIRLAGRGTTLRETKLE
jgi:hypothetical protein